MKSVVVIGAGNVAHHLTRALLNHTIHVTQIFNRTIEKAQVIGEANNIRYTDKISELEKADLYIIATADKGIEEHSHYVPYDDCLVVHTSGSMPVSTLKGDYRKGVLYPLQTFSKERKMRYDYTPFLVEAENAEDELNLFRMAKKVSNNVHIINSETRLKLHLAAVWVCNFSNQMYEFGNQICKENDLDFNVLRPLIAETAKKIEELTPKEAQTGPAKRNDTVVLKKHEELLKNDSEMLLLYQLMTKQIQKSHHEL